jgi:hypothetical protein
VNRNHYSGGDSHPTSTDIFAAVAIAETCMNIDFVGG